MSGKSVSAFPGDGQGHAERMQRLVTDVLDLARFRSGTLTLQARRFDAIILAGGTGSPARVLAEERTPGIPNAKSQDRTFYAIGSVGSSASFALTAGR